ncbi:tagaturonate reductase [Marinimicrobium alkaliphilum]|uniref:tagaturonate reductase n=1 Tax=Marinimicrobium alkaliphilum TaxID=2202654 RepID=UPI000DB95E1D|nr:tagaturonate reductase [Marinimicrobium alkaliphilum]
MKELNRSTAAGAASYPERILQYGEGNFLRAFTDWMIHKMNKEADFNAGVTVVQPIAQGMADMLNAQDGLYHLYLQGIKNGEPVSEVELIDCINHALNPYSQFADYVAIADNPALRFIVSNTTEAGIAWDDTDTLDMQPQKSFPAKVTAFLHRRFQTFDGAKDKGLIILCCELIEHNADILKKYVLQHAERWNLGADFIAWVEEANAFCSTLVDRIVPGFPRDKIDQIQSELGYKDNLVVEGEYFHVWVIEAPAWVQKEFPTEQAGLNVIFTDDMTAYRDRKVRILNGSHTASFAVSLLYPVDTVQQAIEHPVISQFMKQVVFDEVCPNINLPKDELKAFAEEILERFYNPYIKHFWKSIALNSMAKWETRVLPSLLDFQKRTGELPTRIVFSLAALMAYYQGEPQDSEDIVALYRAAWSDCDDSYDGIKALVTQVLAYEKNWKTDLNQVPGLTELTAQYLYAIRTLGMEEALEKLLADDAQLTQRAS